MAFLGIQNIIPVMLAVVIITLLDCCIIASAIPMQLSSSIMIQTSVEQRMLGAVGVAAASLLYRKSMDAIPVGPDKEAK
ncbi:MAG: hypothetical protein Q4C61_17075 [Lachnospiraceae bacterium]|nr:hypothetical protein [Lachnospiraceae bacterium]